MRYSNNSLTPVTFADHLNAFKDKCDNLVKDALELEISHKKVGGLHHWKVGRLGGSVYWKKAPKRATKPVAYKPELVEQMPEPTMSDMELLKMEWRIKQIQDRKTSDVGAYDWQA